MARPKVLVVEDEPLLLMLSADCLRYAGFDVIEAITVDDALALLHQIAPQVAVVFSDIETPGKLNGLKLVEKIKDAWPEIPIVLTSGRIVPSPNETTDAVHFVGKPYKLDHVCSLITDLAQRR